MPYHVRITPKSNSTHDEVRLDISEEELHRRFLEPYHEGRPIVIGGKTIPPDDIDRIRINFTDQDSEKLFPIVRAEREASNVITWIPDEWYVADKGKDVTDQLITGPAGSGTQPRKAEYGPEIQGPKVVFVIHGRNWKIRNSMFDFLRSIGVHPLEWTEAIAATGKASPYIGEILDAAFEIAQAVVVLMTPDDTAVLREEFRQQGDPQHEITPTGQARPNVIFEAGMALARSPERTIIVEVGELRPFSDSAGRHVVRLDNSTQRRQELANRLKTAGVPVNLGGTDWHTTGDFKVIDKEPKITDNESKKLLYEVSEKLEKVDVSFVQNSSPQKIVVLVANRGEKLIHIQSIKFQPHGLSLESFPTSYTKIDASRVAIPFPESRANLEKGQRAQIEIELRQKWKRSDIETMRGELGFLSFDVIYDGKHVSEIIKPI